MWAIWRNNCLLSTHLFVTRLFITCIYNVLFVTRLFVAQLFAAQHRVVHASVRTSRCRFRFEGKIRKITLNSITAVGNPVKMRFHPLLHAAAIVLRQSSLCHRQCAPTTFLAPLASPRRNNREWRTSGSSKMRRGRLSGCWACDRRWVSRRNKEM